MFGSTPKSGTRPGRERQASSCSIALMIRRCRVSSVLAPSIETTCCFLPAVREGVVRAPGRGVLRERASEVERELAGRCPVVGAQRNQELAAPRRDGTRVRVSVDRDGNQRNLAAAELLDDVGGASICETLTASRRSDSSGRA